jgi:hypothetical protein
MNVRRMKTYTGGQGYVYQYYFVGKRAAISENSRSGSTEYIFDVTSDRKTTFAVSVFLSIDAVQAWSSSHGRALTDAEQYGAAKMRLFRGFDDVEDMLAEGRHLWVTSPQLEESMAALKID